MDMAKTERLMEEVRARSVNRPACGCRVDWGAGVNICGLWWMGQRLPGWGNGRKCRQESLSKKFPISIYRSRLYSVGEISDYEKEKSQRVLVKEGRLKIVQKQVLRWRDHDWGRTQ
jgi:hypothetical protein